MWAPAVRQPEPRLKVFSPTGSSRTILPRPACGRAVRGIELDCTAGVALNQDYARGHEPLSALRGEREGPDPQGWEGEVGGATNRLVGPPHPTLFPRPAGGEGKGARRQSHASAANLQTAGRYTFPGQPCRKRGEVTGRYSTHLRKRVFIQPASRRLEEPDR
jgi:hypothetical protein